MFPADFELKGHVLVVDDQEPNRMLLRDLVEVAGHRVTEAVDGEEALACIAADPPDVVLLDVMMPRLDGFEVCRRLKSDPLTAAIPVLLVTALAERNDRLTGMKAGANDFLTKPIDTQDVVLRVRNALLTKALYDQVRRHLRQLEELERLRDNLTQMIVHDMRSPLLGINGYLDVLHADVGDRLEPLQRECLEGAIEQSHVLIAMASDLLDVSRLEARQMPLSVAPTNLTRLVEEARAQLGFLTVRARITIDGSAAGPPVPCDPDIIRRVIANLLANALKFTRDDGEVRIRIERHGTGGKISVADDGPGIPPEVHSLIFEKFGQVRDDTPTTARGFSTGLGLAFCKLAVEAHEGEIGVESVPGKGSTFWFTLPGGS